MEKQIHVSSSPHIKTTHDTPYLMKMVIIALAFPAVFGVINFGWRALAVIVVSIASSMLFEALMNRILHKSNTLYDGSAIVTGLLLALNVPVSVPLWLPVIGSAFAIIIVKMLFGGLGQNIVNPAMAARCFLLISFAGLMCDYSAAAPLAGMDALSSVTPLAAMKANESIDLMQSFLGFTNGTIGETSVLAILIGAALLIWKNIIDIRIPLSYLLSFSVFVLLMAPGFDFYNLACQLCSGGLMLGAFFMATDYVTSPITPTGRIVFGILLGFLTALFRLSGNSVEGVSYAILFCNLLVPLIEKLTIRTAFGKRGERHA